MFLVVYWAGAFKPHTHMKTLLNIAMISHCFSLGSFSSGTRVVHNGLDGCMEGTLLLSKNEISFQYVCSDLESGYGCSDQIQT